MNRKVRMILYGMDTECRDAVDQIKGSDSLASMKYEWYAVESKEALEAAMVEQQPTVIIVLVDGAAGMEGVYMVKSRRPDLPVFWFSDDSDFGILSHRLNCAYFSTKPITSEKIDRAIQRCIHVGISLDTQ